MAVDNSGASPAVAEREPDLSSSKSVVKVSLPSPANSSPNSSSSPTAATGLTPPSSSSAAAQLALNTVVSAGSQPIHSIDAILGLKAAAERSNRQHQLQLQQNQLHNLHHYHHHLSPSSHHLHHHLAHHLNNNNNDSNHLNHHHFLSSHMMLNGGGGKGRNSANSSVLVGGSIYVPPGCHSGGDGSENNFSDSSGPPSLSSGSADYHYDQLHHQQQQQQHHQSSHHQTNSSSGGSGGMDFGGDHRQNSDAGTGSQSNRRGLKRKIKGEPATGTYLCIPIYLYKTMYFFDLFLSEKHCSVLRCPAELVSILLN